MKLPNHIEDLQALVTTLLSKLAEQDKKIAFLEQENKELRARLNMDSHNSSKPPSSDLFKNKKQPAFPREKKGKQGGQINHKGNTLKMVENPDTIEVLKPETCECGQNLSCEPYKIVKRRQLIEIPQPKLDFTEYQTTQLVCPGCGRVHLSEFPPAINAPIQYGARVNAFLNLLNTGHRLSFGSSSSIFNDMYGYPINEGTVSNSRAACSEKLEPVENYIKNQLLQSATAHADETSINCEKKRYWLHVLSNSLFTYLFVHQKRGKEAMKSEKSILNAFLGWLIHDCWSSYFGFKHLKHAICGAHLLRELQGLIENGSSWAKEFQDFLRLTHKTDIQTRIQTRTEIEEKYDLILIKADKEEPPLIKTGKKGRCKRTKGRNLLERLKKHKSAALAFAFNPEVPFTNNQAERDIRPAKIKQKISGTFRSISGAEQYARISGFISTARKQKLNVFKELCKIFEEKTSSIVCNT